MFDLMENLFPSSRAAALSDEGGGWNSIWSQLLNTVKSSSGITVTPDSALRQTTVFACVRVLAETIAQLPIHVYRRMPNGTKRIAYEHNLNEVIGRRPNSWQTSFEFREMMQGHLALRQNAYAHIIPGALGATTELWPWHPDRVTVQRLSNMKLRYIVTMPDGREEKFAQEEVFHLRGLSSDGLVGMSLALYGRDAIGLAQAQEKFGAKLFANSARPSGLITSDQPAMKPQDMELARKSWHEAYGGEENWHKVAVLFGGLKWQDIGMTNVDSQFLEGRRLSREEIASLFRMPQHMVGILDRSTNNNIVQQSLEFVLYTMLPWIRRWEEAIARDLIADDEQFYVRFNLSGLLRGDPATRAEFYSKMISNGIYTPNECRELEDMDPYEGGDEHFMQGAMAPVSRILNPPEPAAPALPPPGPSEEDKQAAEEQQQAQAIRHGEQLGQINVLQTELSARVRLLAEKDQQLANVREQGIRAELEVEATESALRAALADQSTTSAKLLDATQALTHAELELQSRSEQQATLEAQRGELETQLSALSAKAAGLEQRSAEAVERLMLAMDQNNRLLSETARKMIRWEMDSALRASKKKDFVSQCDAFRLKHAERFHEALAPLVEQRRVLGAFVGDPLAAVRAHLDGSLSLLLDAGECQADELPGRVLACVSGWEDRADELIQHLTEAQESE